MKKCWYLIGIFTIVINFPILAQQSKEFKKKLSSTPNAVGTGYFGNVKVSNLEGLNSTELEMSPVPFKDGLVFTSSRHISGGDLKGTKSTKRYTDLYFSQITEEGSFVTPVLLPGSVNGRLHDGMAAFTKDGKTMYFTRNNKNGRAEDGVVDLKICSAKLVNGEWTDIQDLPFNSKRYSNCHPSLSPDNQKIYFSSNRPGGFGGMDIYVSELKDGVWQEPMNIGHGMNSDGNEIFPFMSESGNLFFSSDGHGGYGGLDIFLALGPEGGDWGEVENIGEPLNSRSDDFGFYSNHLGTFGYLTSSRSGGAGRDDIYKWEAQKEAAVAAIQQMVSQDIDDWEDALEFEEISYQNPLTHQDLQSMDELAGKLNLMDKHIQALKTERQAVTDADSRLVLDSKILDALIEKHEVAMNLHTQTLAALSKKQNAAAITDEKLILRSERLNELITKHEMAMASHAKTLKDLMEEQKAVMAKDKTLLVESNALDDKIKTHEILMADHTYTLASLLMGKEIAFEKNKRTPRPEPEEEFTSLAAHMAQWEEARPVEHQSMEKEPTTLADLMNSSAVVVAVPVVMPTQNRNQNVTYSASPAPVSAPKTVTVDPMVVSYDMVETPQLGQVIRLDNVYYEFDQANFKPESIEELDKVAQLLLENQDMEITLMSHTDSRGESAYNFNLSQRRAEAVLNYLVSRNIQRSRLKARGYGENLPINDCDDSKVCRDEEYALNRRTEFKIDFIGNDNETSINPLSGSSGLDSLSWK